MATQEIHYFNNPVRNDFATVVATSKSAAEQLLAELSRREGLGSWQHIASGPVKSGVALLMESDGAARLRTATGLDCSMNVLGKK